MRRQKKAPRKRRAPGRPKHGAGAKKTGAKKAGRKKAARKASRNVARGAKKAARKKTRKTAPGGAALKKLQPELQKGLSRLLGRLQPKLDKLPRSPQLKLLDLEAGGFSYTLSRLRPPQDDSLTQRQKEIARQVAQGLSNKEIAGELDISPATVAAHLRTIFTKLRVKSRTALAKHALAYYA